MKMLLFWHQALISGDRGRSKHRLVIRFSLLHHLVVLVISRAIQQECRRAARLHDKILEGGLRARLEHQTVRLQIVVRSTAVLAAVRRRRARVIVRVV